MNKIRIQAHTGISLTSTSAISINTRYFEVYTSTASANGALYVNTI